MGLSKNEVIIALVIAALLYVYYGQPLDNLTAPLRERCGNALRRLLPRRRP